MNASRFLLRVYFAGELALELIEGREECGDRLLQRRQVLFDDCPDLLRIHALVLVDEDVAHATESAPRDLWMRRAVGVLDSFGRFADHLEVAHHRILDVTQESALALRREPLDFLDALEDV